MTCLTRRKVIFAGAAASLLGTPARAEAILTEDGLYRQPWFLESLLDLADDLDGATKAGKRLAIMWELRGCPYCRETHLANFARPDIEDYVRTNFDVLMLNIIGAREVTDFDGTKLSEKALARKYDVRYTPTFQFFPQSLTGLAGKAPRERETARAQGYLEPDKFLALFRSVAGHAGKGRSFDSELKTNG